MKTRISALMDGELDDHETEEVLRSLRRNPDLSHEWAQYQLIGDSLRNERHLETDLVSRVMSSLEHEPVVLAPLNKRKADRPHPLMALAATVAGVAVVGWVALGNPEISSLGPPQMLATAKPAVDSAVEKVKLVENEKLHDYLLAHHAHAPTAAVATGARYVRTVSMERSAP